MLWEISRHSKQDKGAAPPDTCGETMQHEGSSVCGFDPTVKHPSQAPCLHWLLSAKFRQVISRPFQQIDELQSSICFMNIEESLPFLCYGEHGLWAGCRGGG